MSASGHRIFARTLSPGNVSQSADEKPLLTVRSGSVTWTRHDPGVGNTRPPSKLTASLRVMDGPSHRAEQETNGRGEDERANETRGGRHGPAKCPGKECAHWVMREVFTRVRADKGNLVVNPADQLRTWREPGARAVVRRTGIARARDAAAGRLVSGPPKPLARRPYQSFCLVAPRRRGQPLLSCTLTLSLCPRTKLA